MDAKIYFQIENTNLKQKNYPHFTIFMYEMMKKNRFLSLNQF